MNSRGFREWMENRDDEKRFELVDGEPIALAPERVGHALLKARTWAPFTDEIRKKGLVCQASPDGMTIEIDDYTGYKPDAVVNRGPNLRQDDITVPNPVIIVEVTSPGTRRVDTGSKLADYFRLHSVRHYLLIRAERKQIIHHHRRDDGTILTGLHQGGRLDLGPPGITLDIDAHHEGLG